MATSFAMLELKYAYLRLVVRNSVCYLGCNDPVHLRKLQFILKIRDSAQSPDNHILASLLRTKSIRRPAKDCTSTLGKWEVTSLT